MTDKLNHEDRLFPIEARTRSIARDLYERVKDLPIVSPHGHTDPRWFAENKAFANATELLLAPDHYLFRMLFSQGVTLEQLGVPDRSGTSATDPRAAWRVFAAHYYLFRGTPSAMWMDHTFCTLFHLDAILDESTADMYYDTISTALEQDSFRPRALFDAFNIEVLATTESPIDPLVHHLNLSY